METQENLFIRHDPIRAVYRLGYDVTTGALSISLKDEVVEFLTSDRMQELFVETQKYCEFNIGWRQDMSEFAGFEDCFQVSTDTPSWKKFSAILGTCDHANQISMSLSEIFRIAQYSVAHTRAQEIVTEQSSFISSTYSPKGGVYGAAMGAQLSISFSEWLHELENKSLVAQEVSYATADAYKRVFKESPKEGMSCCLVDGRPILTLPSEIYACQFGIMGDEDSFSHTDRFGIKLSCHNLDYAKQQIVMLAGYAKLEEIFFRSQAGR